MSELGCAPHADTFARLAAAYAEPHRHYHTAAHIAFCLDELDRSRALATFPAEIELALWFHDAIYDTRAKDNEARSAEWAAEFLDGAGTEQAVRERVVEHVLATRHDAQVTQGDSALMVDIDLAILGQPPARYDAFERAVREEYRWVPHVVYALKRREVLRSFLEREHIYVFPAFRSRYEDSARGNLKRAIDAL